MREVVGDLFSYPCDALVVPCNWATKKNGEAVMGAGVAKQAAQRWPWLPKRLGACIAEIGKPYVQPWLDGHLDQWLVVLPTKLDWRDPSDAALIERMVVQLARLSEQYRWQTIALPRLGCGLGGLDYESEVKPILERYLDDRFHVVTPERAR